jgi:GNAT superfamily N-acetyltransferase
MKVKCFGCTQFLEASDVDGVIEAFVAHGRAQHQWSYPQQAIRNYARNYAEATGRLSDATERLPTIGDVVVEAATADRVDDWLQLFDCTGFAGNPDWASCYCLEPHAPAPPDMPERPWRETRATMIERLRRGATNGYLAYAGGKSVGWVNASLRAEYGLFGNVGADGPDPRSVIGVSCFVIAPPFRRHGIAAALLERVIADAATRGASWIEGYPHNEPMANDAGHFRGPRSMYEARGFRAVEVLERWTVMRRPVVR